MGFLCSFINRFSWYWTHLWGHFICQGHSYCWTSIRGFWMCQAWLLSQEVYSKAWGGLCFSVSQREVWFDWWRRTEGAGACITACSENRKVEGIVRYLWCTTWSGVYTDFPGVCGVISACFDVYQLLWGKYVERGTGKGWYQWAPKNFRPSQCISLMTWRKLMRRVATPGECLQNLINFAILVIHCTWNEIELH